VAVTAGGFDPELYLWDIAAEEVVAANFDIDAEFSCLSLTIFGYCFR
jgi:hypothetical protein